MGPMPVVLTTSWAPGPPCCASAGLESWVELQSRLVAQVIAFCALGLRIAGFRRKGAVDVPSKLVAVWVPSRQLTGSGSCSCSSAGRSRSRHWVRKIGWVHASTAAAKRELLAAGNPQLPWLCTSQALCAGSSQKVGPCPPRQESRKVNTQPKILKVFSLFLLTMSMAFILESRNKPFIVCSGPRGLSRAQ